MTRSTNGNPPVSASHGRSGRADVASGGVIALAGLGLLVTALRIEEPSGGAPAVGPGTLPTALSVLLIVSGVALAILGLRNAPATGTAAEQILPQEPAVPLRKLLVVIGLLVGYAVIFIPLGYMLSTAVYLGLMVTLIDRAAWKRNLIFAVVFAVVVYYGFTELLSVQLPAGILG